ncbi:MAG: hypothetical protein P1U37_00475, partial [Minwuia sp.]|nr:hypothetical protein [Minwuia sp.]
AIHEAVAIRRALIISRPDAFRPNLATSCGVYGRVLRNADRNVDAARLFLEGLKVIEPMFLALPQPFQQLTSELLQGHLKSLQEASLQPDEAALAPIIEKMIEIGAIQDPRGPETIPTVRRT